MYDKAGMQVVNYVYDSWGKLISTTGTLASTVGEKNPYRYRGYRYDTETGLYYLQSRYYNPEWGRFINADGIIGEIGELLGHNIFAYCKNNPINGRDPSGFKTVFADEETQRQYDQWIYENKSNQQVSKSDYGLTGEPNSVKTKYGKSGNPEQERYYGPDGKAVRDRDLTDHGNPKKHPKVPHDHDWDWSTNPPTRGPWYSIPSSNIARGAVVVGTGYLIYRGARMIPSLLPPLWWTIPANALCP